MKANPFTALTDDQWNRFEPLFSSDGSKGPGRPHVSPRFLVNAYIHFWIAAKWVEVPGSAAKTTANRTFNDYKEENPTLLKSIRDIAEELGILSPQAEA